MTTLQGREKKMPQKMAPLSYQEEHSGQLVFMAKFDPSYYVCVANELILGNQPPMSVWATRLLSVLLMQVAATDTSLRTYSIRLADLIKFTGTKISGKIYRDVRNAAKELMKATIEVENPEHPELPWALLHWVNKIVYDGNGTLFCTLSEDIRPYVLDLKQRGYFTKYRIKEILPLRSYFAIRIYQYIAFARLGNKKVINISFEHLRTLCGIAEKDESGEYIKYRRPSELRTNVMLPAVRQINKNASSAYEISCVYQKSGSRSVGFSIGINEKESAKPKKKDMPYTFDIDAYEKESVYDTLLPTKKEEA